MGEVKRKWKGGMGGYILMEGKGIDMMDLKKSVGKVEEGGEGLKEMGK